MWFSVVLTLSVYFVLSDSNPKPPMPDVHVCEDWKLKLHQQESKRGCSSDHCFCQLLYVQQNPKELGRKILNLTPKTVYPYMFLFVNKKTMWTKPCSNMWTGYVCHHKAIACFI